MLLHCLLTCIDSEYKSRHSYICYLLWNAFFPFCLCVRFSVCPVISSVIMNGLGLVAWIFSAWGFLNYLDMSLVLTIWKFFSHNFFIYLSLSSLLSFWDSNQMCFVQQITDTLVFVQFFFLFHFELYYLYVFKFINPFFSIV